MSGTRILPRISQNFSALMYEILKLNDISRKPVLAVRIASISKNEHAEKEREREREQERGIG